MEAFFTFDLVGKVELESNSLLASIDNSIGDPGAGESVLTRRSISAVAHDHTLDAGVGLQFAISPGVHAYGSARFVLLDRGFQSTVAPTAGLAAHI